MSRIAHKGVRLAITGCEPDNQDVDFAAPDGLSPFEVLFDSSEPNAALPSELTAFVGNLGFPTPPPDRPWVFANFVQSIDGLVSFGGSHPGGEWISRSRHDRWFMDLLRAHADALICGAQSLRAEAQYGRIEGGPVYRIVDASLLRLRHDVLGRAKQRNIIITGSGNLRVADYRIFRSEHVDAWIATTPEGLCELGDRSTPNGEVPVLVTGEGHSIDWRNLLRRLRSEYGVRYLLCEGGPTVYGEMMRAGCIDEKFLTIAPQEIGAGLPAEATADRSSTAMRPSSFRGPGFTPEAARWYQWISCRRTGDHEFNRYRARR
jgi:riboflavin biosynthesis pyrimidine reductase